MADHEIIIAGFGGQGLLFSGKVLAYAGLLEGRELSWLPSYGPEMRGGTANCSVVISDEPVGSPLVDNCDVLIAMNLPSLDKFEHTVKPGGLIVVNCSIIDRKVQRDDVRVVYCDAAGIADQVKNPKGANVAILGAMLEKCDIIDTDKMIEAIRIELGARKAKFLEGNRKALLAGKEIAKETWKTL